MKTASLNAVIAAFMLLVSACHHDADIDNIYILVEGIDENWTASGKGESVVAKIICSDGSWQIECAQDWVGYSAKQGENGESIMISVDANDNIGRNAEIVISSLSNPSNKFTINLHQVGYDTDTGTLTHDLQRKHALGYGYNIMKGYASDGSFSLEPILDYAKIEEHEKRYGVEIITEDYRHFLDFKLFSNSSLKGLSNDLTTDLSKEDIGIFGCGETTYSAPLFNEKTEAHYCGYIRSSQIVSTRTIDLAALKSLILSRDSEIFSASFRDELNSAISSGDCTRLYSTFGTHLVISADLGGSISIKAYAGRDEAIDDKTAISYIAERTLGMRSEISSKELDYQRDKGLTYHIDVEVCGGDGKIIDRIESSLQSGGKIDVRLLSEWQKTYQYNPESSEYNAAMVDCRLLPLYDLLDNANARRVLLTGYSKFTGDISIRPADDTSPFSVSVREAIYTLKEEERSNTVSHYLKSGNGCMISYEYVPVIRKDKRVFVAYPIIDGKENLYAGLFLGDESHMPGRVRWLGNNCLFDPDVIPSSSKEKIPSLVDENGVLKEFFCSNGDLHVDRESATIRDDDVLETITGFKSFPRTNYIKIGSLFWSQRPERFKTQDSGYGFFVKNKNGYYYLTYFIEVPQYFNEAYKKEIRPLWNRAKNSIPNESQIKQLLLVTSGVEDIYFNEEGSANILGLDWAKGMYRFPDSPKRYDENAYIIPCHNESGEIVFYRLSRSGKISKIDAEKYSRTFLAGYGYAFYTPVYYVCD